MELKYKSWEDITIPIYEEFIRISKREGDSEAEAYDREMDMLAVLCDADRESLGKMLINEYSELARQAHFFRKLPEYKVGRAIKIKGVKYRIHTDMDSWTLAQFTEWQCLRANEDVDMAKLLACILIPEGYERYADGYDVAVVVSDITDALPYYKAHSILGFFSTAQQITAVGMLRSTAKRLRKMARKESDERQRAEMEHRARQLHKAYISLGRYWLKGLSITHL